MSKRKPKFKSYSNLASGTTLSESLFGSQYPSVWSAKYRQDLYAVNVSNKMLRFIERMADDPTFRAQVEALMRRR